MIILEDLSPEKRKEYLEKEKTMQRLEDGFNCSYKSRYTNIYKIKRDALSHVTAEDIIHISLLNQNTDYHEFDFTIVERKVLQGLEFLPKTYLEVMDKIGDIKNHIICRVNKKGVITEILNKEELKEKWLLLKNELLSNNDLKKVFREEDLKKLISAGNTEYEDNVNLLIPELNKNIVFMALLLGLTDTENISKRSFYSYIFPENQVSAGLTIENEEEEDEKFLTFSVASQKPDIDRGNFKKKYLKNFSFLHEPFDEYYFDFIALYTLEKDTSHIERIKLTLDEKINESISSNIICEIQKIENV